METSDIYVLAISVITFTAPDYINIYHSKTLQTLPPYITPVVQMYTICDDNMFLEKKGF